ncbi:hypothetical protein FDX14_16610 [Citrobacter sp. wls710]|uniref:hypothetical protein n=1 Tax=Citrobacter sp. wls710 TaxID=2576426 RepID=UPI0010C96A65|nr:hypothetical protein [Citrobacter sp. wls710]TKU71494.1 hypothetical protein FDX14_16610 [Citrobacter sp. wls710]
MKTNHPAHGPVSLERLQQISEILSKAAAQSDGGNLGYAMADAVKVINSAIAAFGAEPVAWIVHARGGDQLTNDGDYVANAEGIGGISSTPLYIAPPAPAVPFALPVQHWEELCRQHPDMSIGDAIIRAAWWNHCAAMLKHQSSNHTSDSNVSGGEIKQPSSNSFTDEDLEMMTHGDNPQSNAYRELLAFRRNHQDKDKCEKWRQKEM